MEIYLISIGESITNSGTNLKINATDSKVWLTEKGKRQAKESAKFLKDYISKAHQNLPYEFDKSTRVWISPYNSASETFEIFDKEIGFRKCGIKCMEDILLTDQEFGLFDSISQDQREESFPKEYSYYKRLVNNQGEFFARCPMGESPRDVAIRCRQFFDTMWRDHDNHGIDKLFIFAHSTVLRAFTMVWNHYSPEWYDKEQNPSNCYIRHIMDNNDEGYIYKKEKKTIQLL